MTHEIPESISNSAVEHCINEYVRKVRDREILRDHWFNGLSMMAISEKYDLSLTCVKSVVYDIGDTILQKLT